MKEAKEKAIELYNKFILLCQMEYEHEYAIECALIAVDEIIEAMKFEGLTAGYWQEVKKELEAMK